MFQSFNYIILFLCLAIASSYSQTDSTSIVYHDKSYQLGPGDILQITIYWGNTVATENRQVEDVEIRANGKIFISVLGDIPAANLTTTQLEQQLFDELQRFIKHPRVFVDIKQYTSRRVTVFGEAKCGIYPLPADMRIVEFLSSIGGIDNTNADISNIRISRKSSEILHIDLIKYIYDHDLAQNIFLEADDLILIPAITDNKVTVIGQVNSPGVIPVRGKLTLLESLVRSGGANEQANFRAVKIIRMNGRQKDIQSVNIFKHIQDKKETSIYLEAGDIVYVPHKNDVLEGMNKVLRTILPSLQTYLLIHALL